MQIFLYEGLNFIIIHHSLHPKLVVIKGEDAINRGNVFSQFLIIYKRHQNNILCILWRPFHPPWGTDHLLNTQVVVVYIKAETQCHYRCQQMTSACI